MLELLQFVPPNFSKDATALVIDDEKYLPQLRELMPNAKIAFMTAENPIKILPDNKLFDTENFVTNFYNALERVLKFA